MNNRTIYMVVHVNTTSIACVALLHSPMQFWICGSGFNVKCLPNTLTHGHGSIDLCYKEEQQWWCYIAMNSSCVPNRICIRVWLYTIIITLNRHFSQLKTCFPFFFYIIFMEGCLRWDSGRTWLTSYWERFWRCC